MAKKFSNNQGMEVQVLSADALSSKEDFPEGMAIAYVLFGSVQISNPAASWKMKQGDVALIYGGVPYHFQTGSPDSLTAWIVLPRIPSSSLEDGLFWCNSVTYPGLDYSGIRKVLDQIISHHLDVQGQLNTYDKPDQRSHSGRQNDPDVHKYDFRTLALSYQLLAILKEEFFVNAGSQHYQDITALIDERTVHITAYIRSNFDAAPSLAELAEEMHLSVSYLSHYIAKNMGTTFSALLNQTRLSYAAKQLTGTDDAVTKIAMDSGFSNLSTFHQAFQKRYHVSASEYRKFESQEMNRHSGTGGRNSDGRYAEEHRLTVNGNGHPDGSEDTRGTLSAEANGPAESYGFAEPYDSARTYGSAENMLQSVRPDYFQKDSRTKTDSETRIIDVKTYESESAFPETSIIDLGDLESLKGSRVRQHLALLKKKIDVKYARFCQVFTDPMELGEYISDQEQDYDFSVIDSCLDYLLSLKIRPCFCMQLTTNSIVDPYRTNERHAFHFNNLSEIETLFRLLLRHEIPRYGYEEVRLWLFELTAPFRYIKNDPVITSHEGTDYNRMLYRVLKDLVPDAKICAGNFSLLFEDEEILRKISRMSKAGIHPDYVTCISFPNLLPDIQETDKDQNRWVISRDFHRREVQNLRKLLAQTDWKELPIIVTEFGPTSGHRNPINDTRLRGAYLIHTCLMWTGSVKGVGLYWLSDVAEAGKGTKPFLFGGFGLIQREGILKAAFYAFQFLSRLKKTIVARDEHSILTCDGKGTYVLVAENLQLPNLASIYQKEQQMSRKDLHQLLQTNEQSGNQPSTYSFEIKGLEPGPYRIRTYLVTEEAGDLDVWAERNDARALTQDDLDYARGSTLPRMTLVSRIVQEDGTLSIQIPLAPNDFTCVEFEKKELPGE